MATFKPQATGQSSLYEMMRNLQFQQKDQKSGLQSPADTLKAQAGQQQYLAGQTAARGEEVKQGTQFETPTYDFTEKVDDTNREAQVNRVTQVAGYKDTAAEAEKLLSDRYAAGMQTVDELEKKGQEKIAEEARKANEKGAEQIKTASEFVEKQRRSVLTGSGLGQENVLEQGDRVLADMMSDPNEDVTNIKLLSTLLNDFDSRFARVQSQLLHNELQQVREQTRGAQVGLSSAEQAREAAAGRFQGGIQEAQQRVTDQQAAITNEIERAKDAGNKKLADELTQKRNQLEKLKDPNTLNQIKKDKLSSIVGKDFPTAMKEAQEALKEVQGMKAFATGTGQRAEFGGNKAAKEKATPHIEAIDKVLSGGTGWLSAYEIQQLQELRNALAYGPGQYASSSGKAVSAIDVLRPIALTHPTTATLSTLF